MRRFNHPVVGILMAVNLFFFNSSTLAGDIQNDAAFTCASAVNALDCISKSRPGATQASSLTSIPINTQALGFTGPINVSLRYDNYLAWILDVGYAQSFYDAVAAFKLSAGLNERRANLTLGYSLTPRQQIKLTYEYLTQNLPFDFASGTVNQWVNQNAFGGSYRYMLDHGIVQALELYGNYSKANSKTLSDLEISVDNELTAINQRRIAGGTQQNYGAAATFTPFANTIIKIGGGYSSLGMKTQWSDFETETTMAYNADISHLLTPTTLVSTGIGNTAAGRTYTGKVSKILPWSLEASLTGKYMATTNDIPGSTSLTAGLSYPAPKTYNNKFNQGVGDLKQWVQKPVIYKTRVLARSEEQEINPQITTSPIPAQNVKVGTTLTAISLQDYFIFNPQALNKVDYQIIAIIKKGAANNLQESALNLAISKESSHQASLIASGPMPASVAPGDYIVTIQATGYRNGAIVSRTDNQMEIFVSNSQ